MPVSIVPRRVRGYDGPARHSTEASMPRTFPSKLATVPLLLLAVTSAAQTNISGGGGASTKPTLAAADYAKWETLGNGTLSPDGKWFVYDLRRGNGSTELRYRALSGDNDVVVRSANGGQFSSNNRWLFYTVTPDTAGGGGRGAG